MSERLTLQDMVDLLADKQDITKKDSETFLREFIALISETIEGKDFVRIKDFGTFKLTSVSARRSVDVNTGDPIEIRAHYKLSFTPDKVLREGVNRPFSHFESILLDEEVVFEDKDKADKKAPAKKDEVKPKKETLKKEEAKTVVPPKKEEPKAKVEAPVKEEVDNKVDEVLKKTPDTADLEKQKITKKDLEREGELADINTFLTKGIVEKKEVAPLVTSDDSSVLKEQKPVQATSERPSRQHSNVEDDDFVDYDYIAEQRKKRNMWIMIATILLVLAGIGYWGYNTYLLEPEENVPYAQNNPGIIISNDDEGNDDVEDTSIAPPVENTEATAPVTEEPKPALEEPRAAVPEQGSKEIEIKSGQTMRMLGAEYYGNGAFWVYIFEENRDKIKSPDAIYAGMKITIAPASKYGIDPDDRSSVRKAERQQMKLFGEFSDK